jgi:hypothetical protein
MRGGDAAVDGQVRILRGVEQHRRRPDHDAGAGVRVRKEDSPRRHEGSEGREGNFVRASALSFFFSSFSSSSYLRGESFSSVIASEAKQSISRHDGLLRRFASRNDAGVSDG